MLEAVTTDLVFTISLKRSTQNLQLSTSWPADFYRMNTGRGAASQNRSDWTQIGYWPPYTIRAAASRPSNVDGIWTLRALRTLAATRQYDTLPEFHGIISWVPTRRFVL
jgi:hypothetical protein